MVAKGMAFRGLSRNFEAISAAARAWSLLEDGFGPEGQETGEPNNHEDAAIMHMQNAIRSIRDSRERKRSPQRVTS